jgi:imidazolonepropionase-like amidohydrolase
LVLNKHFKNTGYKNMKYAYINGKILDGTKDMQVKEGFVILTDNDKIEDIVKAGTDLNGYEKVDLKRRYIMPGLINMHVHLAGNGKPQKKQRDNEKLVKILMGNALMRSIAYGMVAGFAKTELMSGGHCRNRCQCGHGGQAESRPAFAVG